MLPTIGKKALIFQSLFFCLNLLGQSVEIVSPQPGSPVDESQTFIVRTTGELPVRLSLFLNGKLISERKTPPFEFQIQWNTRLTHEVRIVASYADGRVREISKVYEPIAVDVVEQSLAFQCFPFPEKPTQGQDIVLRYNKKAIAPQKIGMAEALPLELWVVLDISGSMHFFLEDLDSHLKAMTKARAAKGDSVHFMIFDSEPRIIEAKSLWDFPDLRNLYRERIQSSVFDALAATAIQFRGGPRRMILLVSDGADDGSQHRAKTVAPFLKQQQVILSWYNPTRLRNRALTRLVRDSGGFVIQGDAGKAFAYVQQQLQQQLHLVAPEAKYPIELRWKSGKILYPRWRD